MKKLLLSIAFIAIISVMCVGQQYDNTLAVNNSGSSIFNIQTTNSLNFIPKKSSKVPLSGFADLGTQKGNWLVGGMASYHHSTQTWDGTTTEYKINSFSFKPDVGYFVMNNLALGINMDFSTKKTDYGSNDNTTVNLISAGPMVRYYFAEPCNKDKLFGQGSFNFGSRDTKSTYQGSSEMKESFTDWRLGVGNAYYLNRHVAFETMIYYGQESITTKMPDNYPKEKDNNFGVGFGFQIDLGGSNGTTEHNSTPKKGDKTGIANQAIEKGNWILGGSAGLNFSKMTWDGVDNYTKVSSYNIRPNAGYFVSNRVAIGLDADYGYSKSSDYPGTYYNTSNSLSAGAWLQWYFYEVCERDYLYGEGCFDIGSLDTKYYAQSNSEYKTSFTRWGIGLGDSYFLNRHVALQGLINYGQELSTPKIPVDEPKEKDNNFGFRLGFQMYIGK